MIVQYRLEPDLVQPGRYYIYRHTEFVIEVALVIYNNYELAQDLMKFLNSNNLDNNTYNVVEVSSLEDTIKKPKRIKKEK